MSTYRFDVPDAGTLTIDADSLDQAREQIEKDLPDNPYEPHLLDRDGDDASAMSEPVECATCRELYDEDGGDGYCGDCPDCADKKYADDESED